MTGTISTQAWVLYRGKKSKNSDAVPGELVQESIEFPDIEDDELLVEPLYGCWETNMTHALERSPVDICRMRREEKIVLGNAGIVRVLRAGPAVTKYREGDVCGLVPIGKPDTAGYLETVFGYDSAGTVGLLARQTKVFERQLQRVPEGHFSYRQWAAFGVRYSTAWSNWRVAYGAWRLQMNEEYAPRTHVWGWGGGVVLAELLLAKHHGCRTAMVASSDERLAEIKKNGITPIDRREFADLNFDPERYETDRQYRARYLASEKKFLDIVNAHTEGQGVSIFLDNIGKPVFRATLRALSRQGVFSTVGWLHGMDMETCRATECISRHTHVHTHGASYADGEAAMCFALETGWMPEVNGRTYAWDEIPQLADDFAQGKISSYFPIYSVHPV